MCLASQDMRDEIARIKRWCRGTFRRIPQISHQAPWLKDSVLKSSGSIELKDASKEHHNRTTLILQFHKDEQVDLLLAKRLAKLASELNASAQNIDFLCSAPEDQGPFPIN